MGRKKRDWLPDYFYHIVCRGNRRDALFLSDQDYLSLFRIMNYVHERQPFEIACYCLMTNHFHILLRSHDQPISKVMSLINKRYASYFNTRYNLTGHVFEERFYDSIIPDPIALLNVSSYIHLNPVSAGLATNPADYKWCSYSYFTNQRPFQKHYSFPFLNLETLLTPFQGSPNNRKKLYRDHLMNYKLKHFERKTRINAFKKN
ncbi:transposase [Radiobacillus kanasensis]|uniref:transposase n=1 Tax=Radiobacillus kanasensis TaxID=2844358 RepID=UPI001E58FC46|nr:transposase [Radiobacillus kanasensis]UFT99247.1 transposase [Radiobacillus kanasensis]